MEDAFETTFSRPLYVQRSDASEKCQIVVPGDTIQTFPGYMGGHGTHEEEGGLQATVCGMVQCVNKLIYVRPLRSRYVAKLGDVVVGRVQEIAAGKWFLDIGSSQKASLQLTAINLPDNVQRRRTAEDELEMRRFYCEGDLICCEVLRVSQQAEGSTSLHTRSARYGRLEKGCLLKIPSSLVPRQPKHVLVLYCRVLLILGNNGYVWIGSPTTQTSSSTTDSLNYSQTSPEYEDVDDDRRSDISRVRNCILCLTSEYIDVTLNAVEKMLLISSRWTPADLLLPEVRTAVVGEYIQQETVEVC